MQCPQCGFFNLPETAQCVQCGNSLQAEKPKGVDIYPPRANKWQKKLRKVKHFYQLEQGLHRLYTVWQKNPWLGRMLVGMLPGLAYWWRGLCYHGLLLTGIFWGALVGVIYFFGSSYGNLFLALLLGVHVYSMIRATGDWFLLRPLRQRFQISFAVALFLLLLVYTPLNLLRLHFITELTIATPTGSSLLQRKDMLLIKRCSPQNVSKGQLVSFILERQLIRAHELYLLPETLLVDRILAGPGDTVEFTPSEILLNGEALPEHLYPVSRESLPQSGKFSVPEQHYFIYPSWLLQLPIRYKVQQSLVPWQRIHGRAVIIYQPLSRRRWLE